MGTKLIVLVVSLLVSGAIGAAGLGSLWSDLKKPPVATPQPPPQAPKPQPPKSPTGK